MNKRKGSLAKKHGELETLEREKKLERRQQFLTEEYYNSMIEFYDSAESFWLE